jgi:hypothetical protein
MPPSSDIVLLGAGRSPLTKQRRRLNRFPKRNFYLGTLQILVNSRIPVDREFLKKYYEEIKKRVDEGVLIVEYKFDKFVDLDELKTLAFGSEEERKAYEESASTELGNRVAELQELADQKKAAEEEAVRLSRVGDLTTDENARFRDGRLTMNDADNLEGSHEEVLTSPDAKAAALRRATSEANKAGRTVIGQTEAEAAAAAASVEGPTSDPLPGAGLDAEQKTSPDDEDHEDPEYHPDQELGTNRATRSAETDPTFKPLPDHWRQAPKPELLTYCEERGIDTSDMPSNKALRHRLDAYLAGT